MCTPPPFLQGGGGGGWGLSLQLNFQKGEASGLTGPQLLEGGCWERGGLLFSGGGCNCHIKNKLKSEIFNDKKNL